MAAPKGNQFWKLRSKHGADGKFETSGDLEKAISEYFENGVKIRKIEIGASSSKTVIELPVPTITGLCFFLGFASRQSFYDLEKHNDFSYTIKRARLFIEQEYEEQLQHGNVAGAIFALKNMGWKDKQEIDMSADVKMSDLTEEQIDKKIKQLESKINDNDQET